MVLAVHERLGHYEVLGPVGAGGMGEVYRTRDSRLDRTVALKILPEDFARDPNRLARFEREAKPIAALSHLNIAYVAGESDRREVFVRPFPPSGARWQVSTRGGVQPAWRGDGRELFHLEPNGNLMSVEVQPGGTFAAAAQRVLFRTGVDDPSPYLSDCGVTDDGQRFLLRLRAAGSRQLKLVLNWPALLGKQSRPAGELPP